MMRAKKTGPLPSPVNPPCRFAGMGLRGLLLAAVLLTSPGLLRAQEPPAAPPRNQDQGLGDEGQVSVVLTGEARQRFPLAFPATEVSAETTSLERAARQLEQTLRDDLENTRILDVQGPAALSVLQLTGDPAKDLIQYRSLGNEILLLTEVKGQQGQLVFEGRLIDLQSGESILGKRYQSEPETHRRIAHTFSDEVVRYLTGRPGIATTTIVFSSDRTGQKELFLMDYDGANQRRLTAHKSISMTPAWRASGEGIAYMSYFDGPPGLYEVDLASGRKRPLVADGVPSMSPTFSPDGRRMALARSLSGNVEIFVGNANGQGLRQVSQSRAIDTNPAWSPTGQAIAFTSSRAGNPHIYVMDPEGTNLRRISFEGEYNDGASWDPEGRKVVYASRRGGIFQIAITDVVTLETSTLTSGGTNKERPSFSPDGSRIAFTMKRGSSTHIYVVDVDGSHMKQLTSEGNNSGPSWSPYPVKYQ